MKSVYRCYRCSSRLEREDTGGWWFLRCDECTTVLAMRPKPHSKAHHQIKGQMSLGDT